MKPRWQKARLLPSATDAYEHTYDDREIWVEIGRPFKTAIRNPGSGKLFLGAMAHNTNIVTWENENDPFRRSNQMVVESCEIELLARDDSDFAEEVPFVTYEDFVRGQS